MSTLNGGSDCSPGGAQECRVSREYIALEVNTQNTVELRPAHFYGVHHSHLVLTMKDASVSISLTT